MAAVVKDEARGFATVAPAEESRFITAGQETEEIFDMGSFARAASAEITDADGGYGRGGLGFDA